MKLISQKLVLFLIIILVQHHSCEALLDLLGSLGKTLGRTVSTVTNVLSDLIPLLPIDELLRPYESPTFCYEAGEKCGPDQWGGACRIGQTQSPVNLVRSADALARSTSDPPILNFASGWDTVRPILVSNNGHSVVVRISDTGNTDASIELADVGKRYNLSHIHFHWGSRSSQGSEHLVEGKAYAMEIHFVHYDASYGSLENAFKSGGPDAAAVVGVFVSPGPSNPLYDPIIEEIGKNAISFTKGYKRTKKFTFLKGLLPTSFKLYRYQGSLTVPPCTEKVSWVVLEEPIYMSEEQLSIFRKVHCGHNIGLANNFRPVQPLNQRAVRYSAR